MVGLIDIAPIRERADVRGNEVEVRGLTVAQIGGLVWRFPEFRRMYETRKLDLEELMKQSDAAIAALIAAACPQISEESALNLTITEQAELLVKVLSITMPRGIGPFVELMEAVGLGAAPSALVSATNSGTPSKSSDATATPMQ